MAKPQFIIMGFLALALLLPVREAVAQAGTAQLNHAGWFNSAWSGFIVELNAVLDSVLTNGSYVAWARNLTLGAFVITFIGALGRYALAATGDLPRNFHPAVSRALGEVTPCGAV